MSSTETGHIFGTIVYENSSTAEKTYINLNDIHMDIMDYIKPASCTEEAFRSMWAEFEWENKVRQPRHIGLAYSGDNVVFGGRSMLLFPASFVLHAYGVVIQFLCQWCVSDVVAALPQDSMLRLALEVRMQSSREEP